MLHVLTTMLFIGAGMVSLAVIAAMLADNAGAVAQALHIRRAARPLPPRNVIHIRIIQVGRFAPPMRAQPRAAA